MSFQSFHKASQLEALFIESVRLLFSSSDALKVIGKT